MRGKKRTDIRKRNFIDAPFAKYVLSKNLYILILNDEVPSPSFDIIEQIEVIQEEVLPRISKHNG